MPSTKEKKYFKLFACCLPVKGAVRSAICDVQRGNIQPIPNDLYNILLDFKDKSIDEIKSAYNNECDQEIDEYFQFLEENEWGFWCNNPESFPNLDLTWERPHFVTNALIDVDKDSNYDFKNIIKQLDELGCIAIQFRFYCSCELNKLKEILSFTQGGRLRSVEIVVKYSDELTEEVAKQLLQDYPIISYLSIHSSPKEYLYYTPSNAALLFIKQIIDSNAHCGRVELKYFSVNLETFTEAQKYNTCLNRKVSIDVNGEIKNCPSFNKSFGNISNTFIKDIIKLEEFRKLWNINKDQVEICKDCEFRYVCTDCRAFTSDSNNIYSKPKKCAYNPYTAEWEVRL